MRALFLLSLLIATLMAPPARAGVEEDYQAAREAYWSLTKDEGRRAFRHHWLRVVRRLDAVHARYPKSARAPEALYLSGEAQRELAKFSGKKADREGAVVAYRTLVEGWPSHRLADDGAVALAHLLLEGGGGAKEATRVVQGAMARAKDKKRELVELQERLGAQRGREPEGRAEERQVEPPREGRGARSPKREVPALVAERPARRGASAMEEPPATKVPRPSSGRGADAPSAQGGLARQAGEEAGKGGSSLVAAIHRAVTPLSKLELRLPSDELPVQARRTPTARPIDDALAARSDVALTREDSDADSTIVALQEELRDVRVGVPSPQEDPAVRAQLRAMTNSEEASEVTLAQQLGLKVRRVVIDAGHGGRDTGAIGPQGTREKDVALAIATKLARRLEAMGLEVVMTREDDRFVTLEDRTRIANQAKGDLFISVHCNAAPSRALRGIETYTLNTSSNRYAIRLAARENATSERGVGDLRYILADLATRANTSESSRLARQVQRSLVSSLAPQYPGVRDLGTKEALFFVLLGARMPAILVETSFISNPEEEQRLAKAEYQSRVADAISQAVGTFLEDRTRISQVVD